MMKEENVEYDYSELLGLIKTYCGTQARFAELIGISLPSLTGRLSNRLQFKQNEMAIAQSLFGLSATEMQRVFFTKKTKKSKVYL